METKRNTATQHPNEPDWRSVLAGRRATPTPGRLVPHLGKAALLHTISLIDPAIDAASMSATAVISTPTPDRSDDVVEPEGVRLENYTKNPVVYFDHGYSGITLPIAKSEDPDGRLTVTVTPDGIEATSYFAQSMREACQIFDLIEQKIIRSTSINLTPLEADVRTGDAKGGRAGLHIKSWELLEWSWVGIPDNPEAVRKVLDGGKLAGSAICDPIRKCLIPFAARHTRPGRGHFLTRGIPMESEMKARTHDEPEISGNGDTFDDPDDVDADENLDDENSEGGDGDSLPHGARTLAEHHMALSAACKTLDHALELLEHQKVKSFCRDLLDTHRGQLEDIAKCYQAHYPDQPTLRKDESDDDESDASMSMSYLAANRHAKAYQLLGFSGVIRRLAVARNLTAAQKSALRAISDGISRIYAQARRLKDAQLPQSEAEALARMNQRLDLIEKKMTSAATRLLEAIPHRSG